MKKVSLKLIDIKKNVLARNAEKMINRKVQDYQRDKIFGKINPNALGTLWSTHSDEQKSSKICLYPMVIKATGQELTEN